MQQNRGVPTPRRVAIYARVSKAQGQDTENQLAQLRDFCASYGWEIVHEYIDHITGKHSDREQFKACSRPHLAASSTPS